MVNVGTGGRKFGKQKGAFVIIKGIKLMDKAEWEKY